jgi:two-component system chemotaxis response regulator CheY
MKSLIVEDDLVSSQVVKRMISHYGQTDTAEHGGQAIELFRQALEAGTPYNLILMDIMMPEVDGLRSVLEIRKLEALLGVAAAGRVTVIMTTSLSDPRTVMKALYESDANSYLIKPISLKMLTDELNSFKLI